MACQLSLEGGSIEYLPHLGDEAGLNPEEEGMLDGNAPPRRLQVAPGTLVRSVKGGSHGSYVIIRGDRVDFEAEVRKGCVPIADNGCELIGVSDPSVAADMEPELGSQQSLHIAEVLPVPAFFEYHAGDVDRMHAATVAKLDCILRAR